MEQVTIITPCIRYQNLHRISESIPKECRWIVILDMAALPPAEFIPKNAECHTYQKPTRGYPQSNYGLSLVKDGWVYFLDDDTVLHSSFLNGFLETISSQPDVDFIHFNQSFLNGRKRIGGVVTVGHTDKGSFIARRRLIGTDQFENRASADGLFAEAMFKKAQHPVYVDRSLSIYNALREVEWTKWTIIIPTMWFYPDLLHTMLAKYEACPYITEVLVVNNNESSRVPLPYSKVRIIGSGVNMFVNPAWNLAVEHTHTEKMVLGNDDIEITSSLDDLFSTLNRSMRPGMAVGPHSSCIPMYKLENPKTCVVEPGGGSMKAGSGIFVCMYKKDYHVIPEELPVWHGDLIQYEINDYRVFRGATIVTNMRGTTSKIFRTNEGQARLQAERQFYLSYKANGYTRWEKSKFTTLNVVLILKIGGDFTMKDVLILGKHLKDSSLDVRVHCLTDALQVENTIMGVHFIPMLNPWKGWWSKMNLFDPALDYLRPFLFMDLDTVVLAPVESVLTQISQPVFNKFIMLEDFYRRGLPASGMMWFPVNNEKVQSVWTVWLQTLNQAMTRFRGDQDFIQSVVRPDIFWQQVCTGIVTFKPNRRLRLTLFGGEKIVCFHGQPRIPEAAQRCKWVYDYYQL